MLPPDLKLKIMNLLKKSIPNNIGVVEQSISVPFFGDIEKSFCATIGINPSDKEFLGANKQLLIGNKKRFVDRQALKVADNDCLNDVQADMVYQSLIEYFYNKDNVYKTWFCWTEYFVGDLFNSSYYKGTMVNLDIYPWATKTKWAKIGKDTKQSLLQSYDLLRDILLYKNKLFDYVYINGETVKKQLESVLNITISEIRKISIHGKTHSLYKYVLPNGCVLIGNSFYLQQALNNEDRNTLKQQTKSIM